MKQIEVMKLFSLLEKQFSIIHPSLITDHTFYQGRIAREEVFHHSKTYIHDNNIAIAIHLDRGVSMHYNNTTLESIKHVVPATCKIYFYSQGAHFYSLNSTHDAYVTTVDIEELSLEKIHKKISQTLNQMTQLFDTVKAQNITNKATIIAFLSQMMSYQYQGLSFNNQMKQAINDCVKNETTSVIHESHTQDIKQISVKKLHGYKNTKWKNKTIRNNPIPSYKKELNYKYELCKEDGAPHQDSRPYKDIYRRKQRKDQNRQLTHIMKGHKELDEFV